VKTKYFLHSFALLHLLFVKSSYNCDVLQSHIFGVIASKFSSEPQTHGPNKSLTLRSVR